MADPRSSPLLLGWLDRFRRAALNRKVLRGSRGEVRDECGGARKSCQFDCLPRRLDGPAITKRRPGIS